MELIEARNLPEGEKVYLKKDWMGYRIVNPIKNPDGTINWFNLLVGGKRNLMILIFIFVLLGLLYIGVNELISNYKVIVDNPCLYCRSPILSNLNSANPLLNFSR